MFYELPTTQVQFDALGAERVSTPRTKAPSNHDHSGRRTRSTVARTQALPTEPETWIGQRIIPQPNGCWTWDGHITPTGRVHAGGYQVNLARFVYETLTKQKLGAWVTLEPTCDTEHCCHPEHQVARDRRGP